MLNPKNKEEYRMGTFFDAVADILGAFFASFIWWLLR